MAGTGIGGEPYYEAERWNGFLSNFGLTYDQAWNTMIHEDVSTTVNSNHPLFKHVNTIYYSNGNGVRDLDSNNSNQKIIFKEQGTGNGLFGVYANSGHYQYQVNAVDPDRDLLTYSLDQAPTGMQIDASTGLITWENNDWDWTEKLDVTVKVRDEDGGSDNQSL
jgi:hypothetical protein